MKKTHENEEVKFRMFHLEEFNTVDFLNDQEEIQPDGLSNERQDYLFEMIRAYCSMETQDTLCPIRKGYAEKPRGTKGQQCTIANGAVSSTGANKRKRTPAQLPASKKQAVSKKQAAKKPNLTPQIKDDLISDDDPMTEGPAPRQNNPVRRSTRQCKIKFTEL